LQEWPQVLVQATHTESILVYSGVNHGARHKCSQFFKCSQFLMTGNIADADCFRYPEIARSRISWVPRLRRPQRTLRFSRQQCRAHSPDAANSGRGRRREEERVPARSRRLRRFGLPVSATQREWVWHSAGPVGEGGACHKPLWLSGICGAEKETARRWAGR
jgi:hypothetical protein